MASELRVHLHDSTTSFHESFSSTLGFDDDDDIYPVEEACCIIGDGTRRRKKKHHSSLPSLHLSTTGIKTTSSTPTSPSPLRRLRDGIELAGNSSGDENEHDQSRAAAQGAERHHQHPKRLLRHNPRTDETTSKEITKKASDIRNLAVNKR